VLVDADNLDPARLRLVAAELRDAGPEVRVSGDGDFALLAQRHDGPVLVVAPEAGRSARYRSTGVVLDPVHEGVQRLRDFLGAGPSRPVG